MTARPTRPIHVATLALVAVTACTPFEIDNEPPVAIAGEDRTLNGPGEITLDGSESYDPDGEVIAWQWRFGGDIPGEDGSDEDAGAPLTPEQKLLLPPPAFCPEPTEREMMGPITLRFCELEPDDDPAKATVELEPGGYRFTLFVMDDERAVSADTVEVHVEP